MAVCPLSSDSVFASCWVKSRSYEPASTVLYLHLCAGAEGGVPSVVVLVCKSQALSASCLLKVCKRKPQESDDTRSRAMPTMPS